MNFLFPEQTLKWILWILGASSQEEQELTLIYRVLQRYNGLTVPIREINSVGIDFRTSTLVKKLLKQGFLRVSKTEFELHPRFMNNRTELAEELESFYTAYRSYKLPQEQGLPSGAFSSLPTELQKIPLAELDVDFVRSPHAANAIYEISFEKKDLPSVLLVGSAFADLPAFCWRKLKHHLALLAGERADFFRDKITSYKNLLLRRTREMLDEELGRIQRHTEKELREESSRVIIERIISSSETSRQVLSDLVSAENGYILTRYSYNDFSDFDFLQSMTILERLFLYQARRRKIGAEDYLAVVREAINLTLRGSELELQLSANYPDATKNELAEAETEFYRSYVGPAAPKSEVFEFTPPKEEKLLVHRRNIAALVETRGVRLQQSLRSRMERRWTLRIEQHRFEEAMSSDGRFRELLQHLAFAEDPQTASLLRSGSLRSFLENLDPVGSFVRRLKEYGYGQTDKLFEIDRTTLYQRIYHSLHSHYPWLKGLIFRLLHWLAWSVFQPKNQDEPVKEDTRNESATRGSSEGEILATVGLSRGDETREALQKLWNRLPADILPREEIDRNILTDLHAFYADRSEIVAASLAVIAERNLRRILRQAPHLEGYSKALSQYIELKMTVLIAGHSDLRSKTRL